MALLPRPFGERVGERGTREETVVPRDAPTLALPQSPDVNGPKCKLGRMSP